MYYPLHHANNCIYWLEDLLINVAMFVHFGLLTYPFILLEFEICTKNVLVVS